MFELRRLRMLHELSLRGTLAAVASALSYSPSTISQQLALLEREAGVRLISPDGRRVRLTEQGMALAAHAARVLDLEEQIRAELQTMDPGVAVVRIAVLQTAAISLVPTMLALLATRDRDVRVEIEQVAPEEGLFELEARGFDLVMAEQYPGHTREHRAGLHREILGVDPVRIALAPDDAASSIEDLADRPWVMEPAGTAARQWAVQQCRAAGFEPDVRYELSDLVAHARLIAGGHAVGVLPDLLWADVVPAVRLLDLPDSPARELFTSTRVASATHPHITAVQSALRDAFAIFAGRHAASPHD